MPQCNCGFLPTSDQDYQQHVQGIAHVDDGKSHFLIGDFFEEDG